MKRVFAMLLALCLLVSLVPVAASAATASGTCGKNLKWSLSGDGTLTISGTGAMTDYLWEETPWDTYADSVKKVVVTSGVTSISASAFDRYPNLTTVTLADSVAEIGNNAFNGCAALTDIVLPANLKKINYAVFSGCTSLKTLTIPGSVTTIGSNAFARCTGLESIVIPDSVTFIDEFAFWQCTALKTVQLSRNVTELGLAAFSSCGELKSITIPASMQNMVNQAFAYCMSLSEITFEGDAPTMASDVFEMVNATVYYPAGNATWTSSVRQNYGGTLTWVKIAAPKITTQPKTQKVKAGTKATFSVEATGENLTYQWQYKTSSDGKWLNCTASGNKTATMKVDATTSKSSYYYRCKITGSGDPIYTNAVRLYVLGIKTQPTTQKVKAGTTATFKVSATGLNKTYQWQYKTSSDGKWLNCTAEGNKTATLKVSATTGKSSYYYRCVIKDSADNEITTNTVRLYVLGIKTQPTTQKVKAGTTATFTVSATGMNKTYQWQYKTSESGAWQNCTATGNKTATLKVSATTGKSSYYYRCVIQDDGGNSVTTNTVRLYVLGITTQPAAKTAKAGTTVKFTVAATGAGKTYQWQYKTPTGEWKNTTATGAKTATLSVSVTAAKNGYQYRCIVKDNAGNSVTSNTAKLTVK